MAGRHRRGRAAPVAVPAQRRPRPSGSVDVRTGVEHLVTDDEAATGHCHSGRYLAICGARVLAASLAEVRRPRRGFVPTTYIRRHR